MWCFCLTVSDTNQKMHLLGNPSFFSLFFLSCTDCDNNNGKRILYTGQFTEYRSVQQNKQFIQSADLKIDHLYIDKTLSEMDLLHEDNSIRKTCAAVSDLIEYGLAICNDQFRRSQINISSKFLADTLDTNFIWCLTMLVMKISWSHWQKSTMDKFIWIAFDLISFQAIFTLCFPNPKQRQKLLWRICCRKPRPN